MSTPAIPMPAGAVPAAGASSSSTPPAAPSSGAPIPMPPGAVSAEGFAADPSSPEQTGELINDVGNKVIVPKNGEEFGDTIKRAIAYHRSLTPEQQREAMGKEAATIPSKTAQTLGGAAAIGFLGPALLAAPGEALMETHAALTAGFKALVPAVTSGVIGIGQWAEAHPVAAKAVLETLKAVAKGVGMYGAAKVAGKVIDAHPD